MLRHPSTAAEMCAGAPRQACTLRRLPLEISADKRGHKLTHVPLPVQTLLEKLKGKEDILKNIIIIIIISTLISVERERRQD